ncbi:hypothetical protein VTK26DRAFT_9265 [Humicola hyalothermophila]
MTRMLERSCLGSRLEGSLFLPVEGFDKTWKGLKPVGCLSCDGKVDKKLHKNIGQKKEEGKSRPENACTVSRCNGLHDPCGMCVLSGHRGSRLAWAGIGCRSMTLQFNGAKHVSEALEANLTGLRGIRTLHHLNPFFRLDDRGCGDLTV